jgi:hypothetical protein
MTETEKNIFYLSCGLPIGTDTEFVVNPIDTYIAWVEFGNAVYYTAVSFVIYIVSIGLRLADIRIFLYLPS